MTSALETIRYHSGIAGEEVADMVDELEARVVRYESENELRRTNGTIVEAELREQVEKLTEECVVLRASSRSKLETIANLEWQVEKLTKERDELVNAIDNEMVVTHLGVFHAGDDPKVALNKICCYAQDLGKFFAEDACKEQLAALAEQNEKLRKVLVEAKSMVGNPDNIAVIDTGLSLPNIATPVLNRILAEGMRMAGDFVESPIGRKLESLNDGPRQLAEGIRARADELERSK